jgi:hypothetical protein
MHSQCCNYCHLSSGFSFIFQSSMTIFHHKLLTTEGRDGWTHLSSMTIFVLLFIRMCHPKNYLRDIKQHMTLNIIVSVVDLKKTKIIFFPKTIQTIVCYSQQYLTIHNLYGIFLIIWFGFENWLKQSFLIFNSKIKSSPA